MKVSNIEKLMEEVKSNFNELLISDDEMLLHSIKFDETPANENKIRSLNNCIKFKKIDLDDNMKRKDIEIYMTFSHKMVTLYGVDRENKYFKYFNYLEYSKYKNKTLFMMDLVIWFNLLLDLNKK